LQIIDFTLQMDCVSSDPNLVPANPELPTEIISPAGDTVLAQAPEVPPIGENPVWTGWDVLALVAVYVLGQVFIGVVMAIVILAVPAYRGRPIEQVMQDSRMVVTATLATYALLVPAMVLIVRRRSHLRFLEALNWRWPHHAWRFPLLGVATFFGVVLLVTVLPMPKNPPIDRMMQEAPRLMSFVAVLVAPLVEEFFFRGFLYPVLTRWRALFTLAIAAVIFGIGALLFSLFRQNHDAFWWGLWTIITSGLMAVLWLFSAASRRVAVVVSVLVTAFFFSLIHAPQLSHAWGAVALIFFVGLVLTTIRARTSSLAACVLTHMAYNATLCLVMFLQTDHFRHMERMR
jgi:membrane protease YdiL (CAAX protease family)